MRNYIKVVIVPVKLDEEEKVVTDETQRPPYGYHHVCGVYADTSSWLIATIHSSVVKPDKLNEVVAVMVGDLPIEVDPEYYSKQRQEDFLSRFRFADEKHP